MSLRENSRILVGRGFNRDADTSKSGRLQPLKLSHAYTSPAAFLAA
jgi:hypothetical protein